MLPNYHVERHVSKRRFTHKCIQAFVTFFAYNASLKMAEVMLVGQGIKV